MRSTPASTPHGRRTWVGATVLLTCVLLAMTVPSIGRYPLVSGDDAWVMSASYKLAATGVFGSNLYTGFHEADQHYFIALPVYQLLQAAVFAVFGASIAAARSVTIASAVVVLWATTWLALRWYGVAAAVASGALLVLLRVNLVGLWPGLPLIAVGRTGRYDMTGVAFFWLAIVLLDRVVDRSGSRSWAAIGCGICAGLATLTQFSGAFTIPTIAVMLAWTANNRAALLRSASRIAAGFGIVVIPYGLYVAAHWSAFRGQARLKAGRTDFLDPGFYLDNLRDEPTRYADLIDADRFLGNGVASWLFVLLAAPVAAWLVLRVRRGNHVGDRALLTILVVCLMGLALLDSTNAPLYTIVVWPACCIAFAGALVGWGRWLAQRIPESGQVRAGAVALVASTLIVIGVPMISDSVSVYRDIRERRDAVTDYVELAEQIDAAIPSGAAVIGHERWWWGLHERDYRALNVLYFEWERRAQQPGQPASFADLFNSTGATAVVIDDNARSEIGRYPVPLQEQIAAFLVNETAPAIIITDPSYGRFEIYLRQSKGT